MIWREGLSKLNCSSLEENKYIYIYIYTEKGGNFLQLDFAKHCEE